MAVSCLGGSATTKRQILDTPLIGHELQGPCASLHAALHCTALRDPPVCVMGSQRRFGCGHVWQSVMALSLQVSNVISGVLQH